MKCITVTFFVHKEINKICFNPANLMIKHNTELFRCLNSLSWGLKQIVAEGDLSCGKKPASHDREETDTQVPN